MKRKNPILMWIISMVLCLSFTLSALANSSGGVTAKTDGSTDIVAGVVVDYMGKLKFVVLDRDTLEPISGASIEIYIPSIDRYVLFGITDAEGAYELDIAYDMSTVVSNDFQEVDGNTVFQGDLLYLTSNTIQYRAYKSTWKPYPYAGNVVLDTKEVPQVVYIYLYKDEPKPTKPGGGGGGGGGGSKDTNPPLETIVDEEVPLGEFPGTGTGSGIPKTGVEGAIQYWVAGLIAFLVAGGLLWFVLLRDKEKDKENDKDDESSEKR